MTLSSYRTPREGRRVSMSFNLYRRLNRRILGTPRTFRYPFPSFTAVQSSQPNQERISALAKTAPAETNPPTPSPKPAKDLATSKAYAIINPSPATAKRPPNAPPKVVSHKLLNRAQDVQCYDAVPVSEPEETQAEVEKFIPMLEEYLKRTPEAASLIAHTINICYFFFPLPCPFSVRHPANSVRRLFCERLCLGYFLPPNLKVHGLEQNLPEHWDAVRVTSWFASDCGLTFYPRKYRAARLIWRPR